MTQKSFLRAAFFFLFFGTLLVPVLSWGDEQEGAEEKLKQASERLQDFDQGLSRHDGQLVKEVSYHERDRLTPLQRKIYDRRRLLKEEVAFWDGAVRLKNDLLHLPGGEEIHGAARLQRRQEAETIAMTAIEAFETLRKEYRMVRPALLHNTLVNMGMKKGGLCWHWARDLTLRMQALNLKTYDLFWASAREGTFREHNTLVISSKGYPLSEGLFLDGWKKSGQPFWMRVKDDKKHPWKLGDPTGVDHVLDQGDRTE